MSPNVLIIIKCYNLNLCMTNRWRHHTCISITFGIFSLWLPIKVRKWQIKNTVSIPEEAEEVEEAEAEEETEEAEVEAEEEYQGPKITFVEYDDEDEVFGK